MDKPIIRYKTLPEDKAPRGHKYRKGKWYKEENFVGLCDTGYHCSKNIIDAMGYVAPGWVAKVEVRGESDIDDDKEAWSEIRVLEWYKWTKKDSVSLAIFAAELVIDTYEKEHPNDTRPREAIEAAQKVLENDTRANRSAAESAESAAWSAESAARSAAESAESAAWSAESAARSAESAARSAAESTARSAAESAAWSARSAAESAESAARSAARSARSAESAARSAESAARSAARSAAWSAESAARSAAESAARKRTLDECHNFVIERKFK